MNRLCFLSSIILRDIKHVQHSSVVMASHYRVSMEVPPSYKDIVIPEKPKLPVLPKVPIFPSNLRPLKMHKRLHDIRGPELIHNELLLKQYGIVALQGGQLKHGHIEMMRLGINRTLDESEMFAIWRIAAPWKPITKKGQGKRMGGGKGSIHHYTTPIKGGRIILEIGGKVDFEIVKPLLDKVVCKLPFKAKTMSYESMQRKAARDDELRKSNTNPWTYEYMVKNNMQGCHQWIRLYDKYWFGKYE